MKIHRIKKTTNLKGKKGLFYLFLSFLPLALLASCGNDFINPNLLFAKLKIQIYKKLCGDDYLTSSLKCTTNVDQQLQTYLTNSNFDKQLQTVESADGTGDYKQHTDTLKMLPYSIKNSNPPYASSDIETDSGLTWLGWTPGMSGSDTNPLANYFSFDLQNSKFEFYTIWKGSVSPYNDTFSIPSATYDISFSGSWDDSNNISDFKIDSVVNESYLKGAKIKDQDVKLDFDNQPAKSSSNSVKDQDDFVDANLPQTFSISDYLKGSSTDYKNGEDFKTKFKSYFPGILPDDWSFTKALFYQFNYNTQSPSTSSLSGQLNIDPLKFYRNSLVSFSVIFEDSMGKFWFVKIPVATKYQSKSTKGEVPSINSRPDMDNAWTINDFNFPPLT